LSLLDRWLRPSQNVLQQLSTLQAQVDVLQNQNFQQQALLNIQFRQQGGFAKFDYQQIGAIRDGYNVSSAVYSIVSSIACAASYIPLRAYIVKDEGKLKQFKSMQPSTDPATWYKYRRLKEMSLQPASEDDPLQALLDNPNGIMDRSTFYETAVGFKLLTGNSYIYMPTIPMGVNKGRVQQMHIMPSPYTALIITQTWPKQVLGYELIINGVELLKSTEVVHFRTANYEYSIDGQELYGLSPLKAALRTLKRSNSAEESSTFQFENGGPAGVLYNKSINPDNMAVETLGKSKMANQNEYAGNRNRNKVKYMAGELGYLPLGLSPVDLNILESEQWTFDMLCNVWKVSSVLFNSKAASTESNVKELRKDFWTRAALPEAWSVRDGFNRSLVPQFNRPGVKYHIEADISGIPELQPDMQSLATWLSAAWWITPAEKREIMDQVARPDPEMDKVWMPSNLVRMDDLALSEPDEGTADDYVTGDEGTGNTAADNAGNGTQL
jgi:HK97 family phage portal protein